METNFAVYHNWCWYDSVYAVLPFRRKLSSGLYAILTTGFAGLGSHDNKVFADEQDKVTLEINRLIYQPSDTQFKSGTPVEGAELEVLDVTDTFYDFVTNDKLSRQAAQEKLSKSTDIKGKSLAKAETDNLGKASFTVAKTSNQQAAVYLIKEMVTPVAVPPMEPLVVVLPIVDEQGNEKEFVSLCPKSHGTFTFDKSIDDKQDSYNLGNQYLIDYLQLFRKT